jgi:DNA-binding ferritin-like protein
MAKKLQSKKNIKKNRKTIKKKISSDRKSRIVQTFLELLNTVKLYHWKTRSFSQHKATDDLYTKLNENIDTFVEILLGKDQSRIKMIEKRIRLIDFNNTSDFKSCIHEYRDFLIDISNYFDEKHDSDLLNVRDEILGHINQFLYLMSFDK